MKKLLAITTLMLTISLGGCAGTRIGDFINTIKSAATGTVSPAAIYIARNAFNAVEVSADNYINLKECPNQAPFCHDHNAAAELITLVRSGRVARTNATQFLKDHPNELGPQGLYDALTTATDTIKAILVKYNYVGN